MRIQAPRLHLVSQPWAAELAETGYESLTPDNAERLRQLVRDGTFAATTWPSYAVYRLASGSHHQTGVVIEVPVDDYRRGRVRRHEATDAERVRRLGAVLEATRLELVPLTLAHAPRPGLRAVIAEITAGVPDLRVSTERVDQTVWLADDTSQVRTIRDELAELSALYIADGHHRMAAAEQYAAAHGSTDLAGSEAADFVLGALFPWDEVRILGYHRCVTRPDGVATDRLLADLAALSTVDRIEPVDEATQPEPGVVAMYLDGHWYRMRLRPPRPPASPRDALDLVVLESGVLAPLLDVASDARVTPIPGTTDAAALAGRCVEHGEVGFLLNPATADQVVAVTDAGQLMPSKSTWFDPKARTGPFLRELA